MALSKGLGKEYAEAEASTTTDFVRLPAGGYVCKIVAVEDVDGEKPYLTVTYDIAEGDYTALYADEWGQQNPWAHENRHYYTKASMGMFKGFLRALDESNGTSFSDQAETGMNIQQMIGLRIGYVIGEEEYNGNDGSVKTRLKVRQTKTVQQIREGKFKMPELKKLEEGSKPVEASFTPVTDNDLPF